MIVNILITIGVTILTSICLSVTPINNNYWNDLRNINSYLILKSNILTNYGYNNEVADILSNIRKYYSIIKQHRIMLYFYNFYFKRKNNNIKKMSFDEALLYLSNLVPCEGEKFCYCFKERYNLIQLIVR